MQRGDDPFPSIVSFVGNGRGRWRVGQESVRPLQVMGLPRVR
jgi:hypothetical protein